MGIREFRQGVGDLRGDALRRLESPGPAGTRRRSRRSASRHAPGRPEPRSSPLLAARRSRRGAGPPTRAATSRTASDRTKRASWEGGVMAIQVSAVPRRRTTSGRPVEQAGRSGPLAEGEPRRTRESGTFAAGSHRREWDDHAGAPIAQILQLPILNEAERTFRRLDRHPAVRPVAPDRHARASNQAGRRERAVFRLVKDIHGVRDDPGDSRGITRGVQHGRQGQRPGRHQPAALHPTRARR